MGATGGAIGRLANKLAAATNAASLLLIIDRFLPDTFERLLQTTFAKRYKNALNIQNRKDQLRSRWVLHRCYRVAAS
jgi:hypothetical protein